MQSIRCLVFLVSCALVLSILLYSGSHRSLRTHDLRHTRTVGAYFNWRTPSSLFPPSAVISLTDDNSTFFLARPAAFGADLPIKSLSGQLWVGSGFGDDHIGHTGPGERLEGELGCSDVPGWGNAENHRNVADVGNVKPTDTSISKLRPGPEDGQGDSVNEDIAVDDETDGTDDHLSPASKISRARRDAIVARKTKSPAHADIQSLQESAEIAGKVALLSRGGCGFLDKVEWAQRRGAIAVIVGDDIRGGPLVTMYARGDTSNISIPALFTSHTTAHLLSSLTPTGSRQRLTPSKGAAARLGLVLDEAVKIAVGDNAEGDSASIEGVKKLNPADTLANTGSDSEQDSGRDEGSGWFWSLFDTDHIHNKPTTSKKPSNAGKLDWVMQTDFVDDDPPSLSSPKLNSKILKQPIADTVDDFRIGVHDWRDPDLANKNKNRPMKRSVDVNASASKSLKKSQSPDIAAPARGSTPGSGEYGKVVDKGSKQPREKKKKSSKSKTSSASKQKDNSWLGRFVHGKQSDVGSPISSNGRPDPRFIDPAQPVSNPAHMHDIHVPGAIYDEMTEHEGLWVTLSATSMSNSPFFDTLLVLVISPLVTLTVVYALLLLRSRIRRRRWRAPKSVVERLPVRTYQTMSSTSVSSISSSVSTPASIHTPLLSSSARPIVHRPRSRTEAEHPSASRPDSQSLDQVEEKREAGLAEWRRKYGGKQRECVVCLEEYVDGVSRVMRLPCGHEFHEGCITPWLTTRRRTCPICKGDVVRSLARSEGSSSSAPINFRRDEDEDDVQEQAALLTNDDPSSLRPISRGSEEFEDLERGFVDSDDRSR